MTAGRPAVLLDLSGVIFVNGASAAWARTLGFVALTFADAASLRSELVSLGALPPC